MNVLVLMGDHFRADALGALGNPLARTPNLDRLLGESVRFSRAICQAPVCAPTRHSLATGRYCCDHGVLSNNHQPRQGLGTVAHALEPLGYRRMQFGHMRWTDRAMDTGYEPLVDHSAWRSAMPEEVLRRYDWEAQAITRRTTGGPSPRCLEQYSGYYVAQHAIRAMEDAVERGEPFLCWASFSEPHPPWYPPKEFYNHTGQSAVEIPAQPPAGAAPPHPVIQGQQREWAHLTEVEVRQITAGFYGMVALADAYCGMVLDALDRLGIRDDTAVLFTSDHGEQLYEHGLFTKFCMREASVRVPLMVRVPGTPPGVRDPLAEHVDVLPTICDLAGAETPEGLPGRSLAPLLGSTEAPDGWREVAFSEIAGVKGSSLIRMARTATDKLNVYDGAPGEYYDLAHDPAEHHNRIADPAARPRIEALQAAITAWDAANRR
jgi:choline-sulfatase